VSCSAPTRPSTTRDRAGPTGCTASTWCTRTSPPRALQRCAGTLRAARTAGHLRRPRRRRHRARRPHALPPHSRSSAAPARAQPPPAGLCRRGGRHDRPAAGVSPLRARAGRRAHEAALGRDLFGRVVLTVGPADAIERADCAQTRLGSPGEDLSCLTDNGSRSHLRGHAPAPHDADLRQSGSTEIPFLTDSRPSSSSCSRCTRLVVGIASGYALATGAPRSSTAHGTRARPRRERDRSARDSRAPLVIVVGQQDRATRRWRRS